MPFSVRPAMNKSRSFRADWERKGGRRHGYDQSGIWSIYQRKRRAAPIWKDLIWAFLVGGLICTAGQGLRHFCLARGMEEDAAGAAVSITLILRLPC